MKLFAFAPRDELTPDMLAIFLNYGVLLISLFSLKFIYQRLNYFVDKIAIGGVPILIMIFGVLSYKF